MGEGLGFSDSFNHQKIGSIKGFEKYSKNLCDKLGVSTTTFEPSEKEKKYNEKFEQLISKVDKNVKRKSNLRKCMVLKTPEKIKMMVDKKIQDIKKYNISNLEKDFDENFFKVIEEVYDNCR